jgi:uncharacterized protein YqeY
MSLLEKIQNEMKEALRKGDQVRLSVLRMALSSINYAEIEQQKKLDDAAVLTVLAKEAKKRRESIEAFEKGNRPELAAKEKAELAILSEYLPAQMGRDEIVVLARKIISDTGAKGPGDKGKVMAQLMPQTKGKADGKLVSDIVIELLSSS